MTCVALSEPFTVSVNVLLLVAAVESVTVTAKTVVASATLGVPDTTAVEESKARPAGRAGATAYR